jgi:AcrR family transcriptional regulator
MSAELSIILATGVSAGALSSDGNMIQGANMDERVAITEECIRTAFFEQMQQIGFRNITVSGLAARAGINRTTFYLHYADKYELLERIEDELLSQLNGIISTAAGSIALSSSPRKEAHRAALRVFTFIQEHKCEFSALIGLKGDSGFDRKYGELIASIITSGKIPIRLDLPTDYLVAIISGAHINVVRTWILRNMQETPAELANLVSRILPAIIKELQRANLPA